MGYNTSGSFGGANGFGHTSWGRDKTMDVDVDPADIGHDLAHGGTGKGLKGSGEYEHSWTAADGFHNTSTQLTTPSLFGGRMFTPRGWQNPAAAAGERRRYNINKNKDLFNQQAGYMDQFINDIPDYHRRYYDKAVNPDILNDVYSGNIGNLRDKYDFNISIFEDNFSPSGMMNTIGSWFGGKPDKVETFSKGAQEMVDKGLMEWNDRNSLELTNKGTLAGIGQLAAGPVSTGLGNVAYDIGGPLAGQIAGGLSQAGFQQLNKDYPSSIGADISGFVGGVAPAIGNYSMSLAKTLVGATPLGAMYDTYTTANKFDNLGIAPGGQSYFSRDRDTGRVMATNYDVINRSVNQAVKTATPSGFFDSGPKDVNQVPYQLWPDPRPIGYYEEDFFNLSYPEWRSMFHPWG